MPDKEEMPANFSWCNIFRYFGCFERKKRPSKDEDELAKEELEKFQVD